MATRAPAQIPLVVLLRDNLCCLVLQHKYSIPWGRKQHSQSHSQYQNKKQIFSANMQVKIQLQIQSTKYKIDK